MMTFETEQDRIRETKAIELFCNTFGYTYTKLGQHDIDFKVFTNEGTPIAYVEVKGRLRSMRDAYPLPIATRKLNKLLDKRLNPVVIWCCEDGIIYANAEKLYGTIRYGGMEPRPGSTNDMEFMAYFSKQKALKYIRFQ
jgi:hypothetical protein